jgi:hypothetical protein
MSNNFNEKKENSEARRGLGGRQNGRYGIFWWSRPKTPCPFPASSTKHLSVQTEVAKTLRNERIIYAIPISISSYCSLFLTSNHDRLCN